MTVFKRTSWSSRPHCHAVWSGSLSAVCLLTNPQLEPCSRSSVRCSRSLQSELSSITTDTELVEMGRSRSRSSSRSKHSKSSKHNKKRSRSRDKDRKRRSKSRESKRNRRRESRSRSKSNTAPCRRERAASPPERIDMFGRALSKRSAVDEKQKKEDEEKKAEMERQRRM